MIGAIYRDNTHMAAVESGKLLLHYLYRLSSEGCGGEGPEPITADIWPEAGFTLDRPQGQMCICKMSTLQEERNVSCSTGNTVYGF